MPAIVPPPPAWLQRAKFVSKADAAFLYNEIHVQRAYEQMGVKIILQKKSDGGGGGAVLDIGANIGMFTTRAAEALGPYVCLLAFILCLRILSPCFQLYLGSSSSSSSP